MTFGQPVAISRPRTTECSSTQTTATMPISNASAMHHHDYSMPHYLTTTDHSLHTDMRMYASSPNSLYMYEQERSDMQGSLHDLCKSELSGDLCKLECGDRLSSCGDISMETESLIGMGSCTGGMLDNLDDVFTEWPSPLATNLEEMSLVRDVVWPSDPTSPTCLLSMDDVFQVDEDDLITGPTLAQLNCDISVTTCADDMEGVCVKREKMCSIEGTSSSCGVNDTCVSSASIGTSSGLAGFDCHQSAGSLMSHSAPSVLQKTNNTIRRSNSKTCTVTSSSLSTVTSLPQTIPSTVTMTTVNTDTTPRYPASLALWSTNMTQMPSSQVAEVTTSPSTPNKKTSLQKLLMSPAGGATATQTAVKGQQKRSRSSDSNSSVEKKWQEVKQFIHDEPPAFNVPATREGCSSTRNVKKEPIDNDVDSHDEGIDSDIGADSDMEEDRDWSSDAESIDSNGSYSGAYDDFGESPSSSKRPNECFWMYNMQSKGPKGKRLCVSMRADDPHVMTDFSDPVFDSTISEVGYKHSGKVRRGDGNDTTPNPRKLWSIGNELKKLNHVINDLTPVSELPVNIRPKSRKEKNKLASRACRLKKKAQHEANKVKLHGIKQEHRNLMTVISTIKQKMMERIRGSDEGVHKAESLTSQLDDLVKTYLKTMIAGNTMEYVNSVIDKVSSGDPTGGIRR